MLDPMIECTCCGEYVKALRSDDGGYVWLFNWLDGGGNWVVAETFNGAIALAYFKNPALVVDVSTVRRCTHKQFYDFVDDLVG